MKKIPGWLWSVVRVIVIALIFWQIVSYIFASHEQRLRTDGWPVSSEPAGSNDK